MNTNPERALAGSSMRPASSDLRPADTGSDCWNEIGVNGDGTCPELTSVAHCRHCPVYSAVGAQLLDRELPVDYQKYWTEYFSREKKRVTPGRMSAVVFRVGSEWLALSTRVFQEVTENRKIHSLPHRRNGMVLGLINVRGQLLVCVSLGRLLGIELEAQAGFGTMSSRLMVVEWEGKQVTFPVAEIQGVHRFRPDELREVPATLARSNPSLTRAILVRNDLKIGCLDEESLFAALNRNLA